MDNIIEKFKVDKGKKFSLKDHDPKFTDKYNKQDAALLLSEFKVEMDGLQEKLYAINKHSLLIIFQAMDAAGKDSAIEHTMSGLNPQGCQVYSFKQPSSEELDHDFLWRHYKALPERGRIGIHNRSHYENVLICKVHPEYIFNEHIASVSSLDDINETFWKKRYESIRDFVDKMNSGEKAHLDCFGRFCNKNKLLKHLQTKNWEAFAKGYNGSGYKLNKYDSKMKAAYDRYNH